jgi:hypothetical protein
MEGIPPGALSSSRSRRSRGEPPRRSGRRSVYLAVGALLVVAAIVVALTSSGGSSHKNATSTRSTTASSVGSTTAKTHKKATKSTTKATPQAGNPAETTVTVLNGTEKAGLAHRISTQLQQGGYSQASALGGRPAGANQTTVVEYTAGHRADAEGVARSLSVSQVQPIESAVASLAGSARVVVIVGADTAAKLP